MFDPDIPHGSILVIRKRGINLVQRLTLLLPLDDRGKRCMFPIQIVQVVRERHEEL